MCAHRQVPICAAGVTFMLTLCALGRVAQADDSKLVAPPRTIADIAAVLDHEKPDSARVAEFNKRANAQPSSAIDRKTLAKFYYDRASARVQLGRVREAIADGEMAVQIGGEENLGQSLLRYKQSLGLIYTWSGNLKRANEVLSSALTQISPGTFPPSFVAISRIMSTNMVQLGDLEGAEAVMKRLYDYLADAKKHPGWSADPRRPTAEAQIEFGQGILSGARGRYHEAAIAYGDAERSFQAGIDAYSQLPNPPPRVNLEEVAAWMPARAGLALAREGRLADAEISARRALIGWLKIGGKYNLNTARILAAFSSILVEEGRYTEAETLARDVLDIYQTLGTERDFESMPFP